MVWAGGGKDILFGITGGGGTHAKAAARSVLAGGAGGSGWVTQGRAISLSLMSLLFVVENTGARGSSSACPCCAAPKSPVSWKNALESDHDT